MLIHFKTSDPRGEIVICKINQWYNHILVSRRDDGWEDGDDWEGITKEAIQNPLMIVQDTDFEDRNNYYYRPGPNAFYFKVVVKFTDNIGEVITAFETNNGKKGEKLIWPIAQ